MKKLLPKLDHRSQILDFRFVCVLFIIFLTSIIYHLTSAFAQESISITAIPPRLELSALPGATLQETIKIRNDSADTELTLEAIANDFIVNDNQGTPVAVSESVSGRWSLASWISASPKQIHLKPQETGAINLIISIPNNALPGGHYAMINHNQPGEGLLKNTGSAIIQKVGSLIYLNVIGDVTEMAHLKEFTVKQPFSYYGPIDLTAEIENLGDIHVQPQGQITITNWLKDPVGQFQLETKNIFPFASRIYQFSVPGKYRLGRYAARLNATIGVSQIPLNGLIYFWIVPVKELAAAAIILISLILLIVLKTRKKKPQDPSLIPPE